MEVAKEHGLGILQTIGHVQQASTLVVHVPCQKDKGVCPGRDTPDKAEALFRQLPETNDTNMDPNWWRFEVGRSLGAEEAMQAEDHRLTATALAFHDALPPEETASMQL